jgi:hypothetical protein
MVFILYFLVRLAFLAFLLVPFLAFLFLVRRFFLLGDLAERPIMRRRTCVASPATGAAALLTGVGNLPCNTVISRLILLMFILIEDMSSSIGRIIFSKLLLLIYIYINNIKNNLMNNNLF